MKRIGIKFMYKIAICDDSPADIVYLQGLVSKWARKADEVVKAQTFASAEAFLFQYEEDKAFDILLLDIEMAEMDGVTLARKIRAGNQQVQIVFITGYTDYIADGYEVEALHYLLKPVKEEKLFEVLERAVVKLARNERTLLLETVDGTVRVPLYEIRWIEVQRNYVTIHAAEDYTAKKSLSEVEAELDEGFMRTGRSFIVNLKQVRRIGKNEVILADGSMVPLSRGYYEKLNRAMIERF